MDIEKFFLNDFNLDGKFEKTGGEASVYKAWHHRFGEVAIKQWSTPYNSDNEMKLLIKNSNHPNIIQFVGILVNGKSTNIGYIMPYMPMGSLADVIHNKDQEYDQKQISSWITQICCGLLHLHFKKKRYKADVLLGKSRDDVKLSDFGVARSVENLDETLTKGCWHADASKRPTVAYVHAFCRKSTFLLVDIENFVKECGTSFKNLNVRNSNSNNESLSQTNTSNNIQSTNVQSKITVVPRTPLNDNESPPTISLKKPNKNFPIRNSKKETILLLGEWESGRGNSKNFLMLENHGLNWKQLNIKLPYAIENYGAQFLNNNLYIFGGTSKHSTYKLSKSLKWEEVADMNQDRSYISNSSVILNNQIWVCGGYNNENRSLKSVEAYDPEINKWKCMTQMNQSRSDTAAVVVSGKIFCSGGYDGRRLLNSAECYDPSSNIWTSICNMPQRLRGYGAVELDGNLIVIGGHYSARHFNNVWALDTTNKNAIWVEKPSMSVPRYNFNIAKVHDKIFVCGGENRYTSVEIFDGKMWRDGPKMVTYRLYTATVVISKEFARYLN